MNRSFKKLLSTVLSAAVALSLTGFLSLDSNAATDCGYRLSGMAHVQDQGDTPGNFDASTGILTLGTRGLSRRVEAISVKIDSAPEGLEGSIHYYVHVQDIGWMPDFDDYAYSRPFRDGETAGTSGQSKRLEAIVMYLAGDISEEYYVEYQVHIQDYGDMQGFVRDGTVAGTTGESKRLEEVQIRLVKKDESKANMAVNYRVHRQDYGWETSYAKNGASSGTTGQSKRLEGIEIFLSGTQYEGDISYRTHIQDYGWEDDWSYDGQMSGTQGQSKRLEAIQIELSGQIEDHYDVYYRVHSQNYGWLGWAKNGAPAGTAGQSLRLEAIQIVLVAKGGSAPGSTSGSFKHNPIDLDKLGIKELVDTDFCGLGWYYALDYGNDKEYGNVYSGSDCLDLYGEIYIEGGYPYTLKFYYSPDSDFSAAELASPLGSVTSGGMMDWCLIYKNGQPKVVSWTSPEGEHDPEYEASDYATRDKKDIPSGYYKCIIYSNSGTALIEATCYVM